VYVTTVPVEYIELDNNTVDVVLDALSTGSGTWQPEAVNIIIHRVR
jgi:hypothetical protein